MANIEGKVPPIARVETGFWSMDRALAGNDKDGNVVLGFPMTIVEIFGFQAIGKTTLATYIAGLLAESFKKNLVYAPIEHVDRDYMSRILDSANFGQTASILGSWDMIAKFLPHIKRGKDDYISDEMMIDCIISAIRMEDYNVVVLDSLSALMSIGEMESSSADAVMGKKGILISKLARGLVHADRFRNGEPFCTLLLSHKYTQMGGGTPTNTGTPTTGGEMKKNISKVRIGLRRLKDVVGFYEDSTGTPYDNHAYVLEGKVEKNNFGREGKTFFVAGLGGSGLHHGLTAMYECKRLKIATFGKSVTLGGEKFGSIRSMVEKAHNGEDEVFQPFIEALKNPSKVGKAEVEEDYLEEDAE